MLCAITMLAVIEMFNLLKHSSLSRSLDVLKLFKAFNAIILPTKVISKGEAIINRTVFLSYARTHFRLVLWKKQKEINEIKFLCETEIFSSFFLSRKMNRNLLNERKQFRVIMKEIAKFASQNKRADTIGNKIEICIIA